MTHILFKNLPECSRVCSLCKCTFEHAAFSVLKENVNNLRQSSLFSRLDICTVCQQKNAHETSYSQWHCTKVPSSKKPKNQKEIQERAFAFFCEKKYLDDEQARVETYFLGLFLIRSKFFTVISEEESTIICEHSKTKEQIIIKKCSMVHNVHIGKKLIEALFAGEL